MSATVDYNRILAELSDRMEAAAREGIAARLAGDRDGYTAADLAFIAMADQYYATWLEKEGRRG